MLYEFDVTVETTHTSTARKRFYCKLTHGIIDHFSVYFPPGCAHLVNIVVKRGAHQMFPLNPEGYIKGDNIIVQGKTFHPLLVPPYEVVVEGWADSTEYDHTVTVRFWMLKPWQMMPFSDEMYMLALKESAG